MFEQTVIQETFLLTYFKFWLVVLEGKAYLPLMFLCKTTDHQGWAILTQGIYNFTKDLLDKASNQIR